MEVMEVLQNLTEDQKDRYVKLEATLDSDGWSLLQAWAEQQQQEALNRATFAQNWESNRVAIGEAKVYEIVTTLRDTLLNEFAEIARQNVEAQAERALDDEMRFE